MNKVHFTPYLGMIQHHFQNETFIKNKVAICGKWNVTLNNVLLVNDGFDTKIENMQMF